MKREEEGIAIASEKIRPSISLRKWAGNRRGHCSLEQLESEANGIAKLANYCKYCSVSQPPLTESFSLCYSKNSANHRVVVEIQLYKRPDFVGRPDKINPFVGPLVPLVIGH